MPHDPLVWLDIICGRCSRRFPVKIRRSWLSKRAVVPTWTLCKKCADLVRRQTSREYDERYQLRFRFDNPNDRGQAR